MTKKLRNSFKFTYYFRQFLTYLILGLILLVFFNNYFTKWKISINS